MTSVAKMVDSAADDAVDREKKCPLLLRVFINPTGRHYYPSDYSRGSVPPKEVQIYTWMDATLKELSSLVKEVNQDARKPGTRFDFALVFPDLRTPSYRLREIGTTINGRKELDDSKTLAQSRFQVGDFLDVAIQTHGGGGGGGGGMSNDGPSRSSGGGGPGGRGPPMRFSNGGDHRGGDRGGRDFGGGDRGGRDFGGGGRDRGRPY